MSFSKTYFLATFCLLGSAELALAIDPAPVNLGPVEFIPTLDVDIDNNDNIYLRNDEQVSSAIFKIRPELLFKAQQDLDTYEATIYVGSGTYTGSEKGDDDYLDAGFLLDGHWELNDKNRLTALIHTRKEHDARGDAFTAGRTDTLLTDDQIIKEVDTYNSSDIGIDYELGIGNTNTGFTLGYAMHSRKYSDNASLTGIKVDNSSRNYSSGKIDTSFFYQVQPKTKLFIELTHEDIDYKEDVSNSNLGIKTLDSTETYIYLGTTWEASANTTGTVKIGSYTKDFSDKAISDAHGDLSDPAWEVSIDWTPLENTEFLFSTGSYVAENQGNATVRAIQDFEAVWKQQWLERFYTTATFHLADVEHKGSKFIYEKQREDTDTRLTLAAVYNFRRWVDFKIDYTMNSRSSSLDGSFTDSNSDTYNFEYDQNIISLSANMSL